MNKIEIILPKGNSRQFCCFLTSDDLTVKKSALALASILRSIAEVPEFCSLKLIKNKKRSSFFIGFESDLRPYLEKVNKAIFFPISLKGKMCNLTKSRSFDYNLGETRLTEEVPGEFFFSGDSLVIKRDDNAWVRPQFLADYFEEILAYASGKINPSRVCAILHFHRSLLEKFWNLSLSNQEPITLFTVDAEDQHIYYDNKNAVCTELKGDKNECDDMRSNVLVRESIKRLTNLGIRPTFMVTGSDLRQESKDAFGNALAKPEDNVSFLRSLSSSEQVSVGTHSLDHQRWLLYGNSHCQPMGFLPKMKYFFNSGGDLPQLFRLLIWSVKNHVPKAKLGIRGEFSRGELNRQIKGLANFFGKEGIKFTRFHRHPGFRRSSQVVGYLAEMGYADSSDLLKIENPSPPIPYYLFSEKAGKLSLANLQEYPCLFIDEYLRTKNRKKLNQLLNYLNKIFQYHGTVLTIVSHTKVIGGNPAHCHVYPVNPLSGLAQPMVIENLKEICRTINKNSQALNFTDLSRVGKR
ncbi:MAG: hypothetical protein AAB360_00130 [Patescibacteria group bacterium]